MTSQGATGWSLVSRRLYLVAMAVFLVTIGIGILNGLDVVSFTRDALLAHVHSGTLGWITLSIVATAFWMFRAAEPRLALALSVLVPVYVLAFASGNLPARAIGGSLLLLAILWILVWVWQAYRSGTPTLPRLAVALGVTTFTYGAIVGVLLQVQGALNQSWLTGDAIGAHAAAMVFGYVALVAMGVIEWRLRGSTLLTRGGVVQIVALFVGGVILTVGLLAGAGQAAGGLYLLAEIIAIGLFVARVWPTALRVPWTSSAPARHLGAAAIWIIVAMVLLMVLIIIFISAKGDTASIPTGPLIASDHSVFIGVMTNLTLGVATMLVGDRGDRWPVARHLVFWGLNGGLAIFVVGLITDVAGIKRVGAPIMGTAILIGLAILATSIRATMQRGDEIVPADS
jgi:hypothetical protein